MMAQNYWIEVYYSNGKTLRKESDTINETLVVLNRYTNGRIKPSVQYIKAGRGDQQTGYWDKVKYIAV